MNAPLPTPAIDLDVLIDLRSGEIAKDILSKHPDASAWEIIHLVSTYVDPDDELSMHLADLASATQTAVDCLRDDRRHARAVEEDQALWNRQDRSVRR